MSQSELTMRKVVWALFLVAVGIVAYLLYEAHQPVTRSTPSMREYIDSALEKATDKLLYVNYKEGKNRFGMLQSQTAIAIPTDKHTFIVFAPRIKQTGGMELVRYDIETSDYKKSFKNVYLSEVDQESIWFSNGYEIRRHECGTVVMDVAAMTAEPFDLNYESEATHILVIAVRRDGEKTRYINFRFGLNKT